MEVIGQPDRAAISVYAQNKDYHDIVKKRLKRVGRWMIERFGGEIKVFVDTAPVMEKPLGAAAGLGWQGKHTNLSVARAGKLVLSGGDLHNAGAAGGRTPGRENCGTCTVLSGGLPDRMPSLPRSNWMRGVAFLI